jgi:hypothetical protein
MHTKKQLQLLIVLPAFGTLPPKKRRPPTPQEKAEYWMAEALEADCESCGGQDRRKKCVSQLKALEHKLPTEIREVVGEFIYRMENADNGEKD